jgi:heat shock protein HslJ
MIDSEDPRIWQGLRTHLDKLGSLPTVPPIGTVLDRRGSRRPWRAVAGLGGAGAIVLALGLLLPGLIEVNAPMTGATPTSSSAPATPAALLTAPPVDWGKLTGHSYVAVDVTENGQPIAIVPETTIGLHFRDASHFGASAGCNGMGGDYEIRDGRLMTAHMYMTLKGCLGELGEQESMFITLLQSSPTISRDATGFVLGSGDVVVIFVEE